MLGKLIAAQSSLERLIVEMARSNVGTAAADGQLGQLARLQASIGLANAASLHNLSSEINSAIAQTRALEQQSREQIASASAAEAELNLSQAATASRSALNDAMGSLQHIPLTFSSAEDERAYRDREAERQAYINAQQAKHTPQGDLNAAGAGIGQMVDAKAHGASGHEFDQKWNALVSTTEKLRAQAKANGISTEEFDQRLRDDLRRIMKSKGYSDAQIDAQFTSNPDPLQAAKAFMKDGADIESMKKSVEKEQGSGPGVSTPSAPSSNNDAAAYIAGLKATGFVAADVPKGTDPHHGVALSAGSNSGVRTI